MWNNGARCWIGILLLIAAARPAAAEPDVPGDYVAIGAGVIEVVDSAAGTLIIDGYRYRFDPAVPVQIRGVAGTATQLLPGMRMQFRYEQVHESDRRVLELREIPPGVVIESH